jgi:hypothetical protein
MYSKCFLIANNGINKKKIFYGIYQFLFSLQATRIKQENKDALQYISVSELKCLFWTANSVQNIYTL